MVGEGTNEKQNIKNCYGNPIWSREGRRKMLENRGNERKYKKIIMGLDQQWQGTFFAFILYKKIN